MKLDLTNMTSIKLCFENCEVYKIPVDYIEYINFGGLTVDSSYSAKGVFSDYADYTCDYSVNSFQLVISGCAMILTGEDEASNNFLIKRLKTNDLVSVTLLDEKHSEALEIQLPWDGTEYQNSCQKSFESKSALGVTIAKKHKQEDLNAFDDFVNQISDKYEREK